MSHSSLEHVDPSKLSRFIRDREGTKILIFAPHQHNGLYTTHLVDKNGKIEDMDFTLASGWKRWSSKTDLGADLSFWTTMNPEMKELARYRYKDLRPPRTSSNASRS